MSFQGKTAVITGASSGIGLLCAQCFAEQGANIVMLATNPTKLQSKVDALTAKGYHAIGISTGRHSLNATLSILRAGLVNVLVVDENLAQQLESSQTETK